MESLNHLLFTFHGRTLLSVVLLTLLPCGCQPPEVETLPPLPEIEEKKAAAEEQQIINLPVSAWSETQPIPRESWYVQYVGGKKSGYYRTMVAKGDQLMRINLSGLVELPSSTASGSSLHRVDMESFEYPDGRMASFEETTTRGETITQVSGKALGEKLTVTTIDEEGQKKRRGYKWDAEAWGVLGVHSLLLAHPMKPGDMRTCKIFVPKLSAIVPVEMLAGEPELTSLPGGTTPKLIPVNVLMKHGEMALRSKNWIDENGIILKTVAYGNQMVSTFRAPPEIAELVRDEMLVNSKLDDRVEYRGSRPSADATVTYQIEGSDIDLFAMWDRSPRQKVKSLSALSSEVTVSPSPTLSAEKQEPVDARYLAASKFLQSEHETILRLGKKLTTGASRTTPESYADQIAKNLHKIVKRTADAATFQSALETARKLSGDAKAHSALLVSVLRAQNIPARLAFGICWDEQDNAFRVHVWAEALIEQGWIAYEPRTGGRLGTDALKLFDSALDTTNPYEPILKVYDDMSHINIRRSRGD